jgi:hypothetical protein
VGPSGEVFSWCRRSGGEVVGKFGEAKNEQERRYNDRQGLHQEVEGRHCTLADFRLALHPSERGAEPANRRRDARLTPAVGCDGNIDAH